MPRFNNLLLFLIISTGVISCTSQSLVRESDVRQQALLQHDGRDVINQTGYSDIPMEKKALVISTKSKYSVSNADGDENDAKIQAISSIRDSKPLFSDYANTIESCPDHGEVTSANLIEKAEASAELKESEENNSKKDIYNLSAEQQDKKDISRVGLAHFDLGIAYAESGQIDQAILEFQSATESNPHHLESHVRLGTAYGLKGMTNEALSEFKKAIDIDLNEAVAKIVFNALPAAANQKAETDVARAHINLGNAYKEEGSLKRAQLEYEKALELKPEYPIARKSLSEIYYSLGNSCLEDKKYDNAIDSFNKVLELNPDFPQIKDALKKAHYNLGINYAQNGELDKAIIEFNKTMEIKPNYAMLDKDNIKDKETVSGKDIHHDRNRPDEDVINSIKKVDKTKDSSHEEKKEEYPSLKQMPHKIDVAERMILAENSSAKVSEYDQDQVENQPVEDKINAVQANFPIAEADGNILVSAHPPARPSTRLNEEVGQVRASIVPWEIKSTSGHTVFSYYITRNYNKKIGFNEAIKKYEDATRGNHYDNNAFLSLAYAYYSKAMHLDYAIARREDAPEGNQDFSVQRYYLNDDAGDEVVSKVSLTEQTKSPEEYNMTFHNKLGNMYHKKEMFNEAIKEYKNALNIDPNSSKTLYSLAFSFSKKGSYPGIALKNQNNPKRTLSEF